MPEAPGASRRLTPKRLRRAPRCRAQSDVDATAHTTDEIPPGSADTRHPGAAKARISDDDWFGVAQKLRENSQAVRFNSWAIFATARVSLREEHDPAPFGDERHRENSPQSANVRPVD